MKLLHIDHDHAYYGMKKGASIKNKVKILEYACDEDGKRYGPPTQIATCESWDEAELYFINSIEDLMREE